MCAYSNLDQLSVKFKNTVFFEKCSGIFVFKKFCLQDKIFDGEGKIEESSFILDG